MTLHYPAQDGKTYQLNFIDTPGHVDLPTEVSRSLAACEGAILVVDAGQGVEAQSVANCYTAIEQGLEVMPVLNKMDLPQAEPERVKDEIEHHRHRCSDAVPCSAKSGMGVIDVLEHLVKVIPPPGASRRAAAGTDHRLLVRQLPGRGLAGAGQARRVKPGDKILVMSTGKMHQVDSVGVFTPNTETPISRLARWASSSPASGHSRRAGGRYPDPVHYPGRRYCQASSWVKPQVYAGLFPVSSDDFEDFREALQKLTLNDAPCSTSRKVPTPWASASASASSACCTWRSSRSAWSASMTWT